MSNGKVSAIAVVDLARVLLERGVLSDDDVNEINSDLLELVNQLLSGQDMSKLLDKHLDERQFVELWQKAQESNASPTLGLEIGQHVAPCAMGVLATWIKHCKTLSDGFMTFMQHIVLMNKSEQWTLSMPDSDEMSDESLVEVEFQFDSKKSYPEIAWQRSLAIMPTWAQFTTGEKLTLTRVQVPFAEPADEIKTFWNEIFNCTVEFDQPYCKIALPVKEFQKPSMYANELIRDLVADKAKTLIPESEAGVTDRVLNHIKTAPAHYNSIETVAKEMGMSRSTLYRKLKESDTSFSKIMESYRADIWEDNQRSLYPMSAEALCERMGFTDISSLYKWQKRHKEESLTA